MDMGGATAVPVAGSRPANPKRATRRTGSPDDCPDTWFDGDPTVVVDREEITVIGKLPSCGRTRAKPTPRAGPRVFVRKPVQSG